MILFGKLVLQHVPPVMVPLCCLIRVVAVCTLIGGNVSTSPDPATGEEHLT